MIGPNAKRLFPVRERHEKHGEMKHAFAYPAKNQASAHLITINSDYSK